MPALRLDRERQFFFPKFPLHEGCRNRVDRSSCVDLLPGAKSYVMGRLVHSHRIRPGDSTLWAAEQEGHIPLEFIQYFDYTLPAQAQFAADPFRGERLPLAGHFPDYQIPNPVRIGIHKIQIRIWPDHPQPDLRRNRQDAAT